MQKQQFWEILAVYWTQTPRLSKKEKNHLGLLHRPDEPGPVSDRILSYGPEHIGHQRQDGLLRYAVLGGAKRPHRGLAIPGASVLRDTLPL